MSSALDRLIVQIRPFEPEHAPIAHLDPVTRILSLSRHTSEAWPLGLDLSAKVLLDFDQHGRLANLDLMIPPSRWPAGEFDIPEPKRKATLAINVIMRERSSCALPVEIREQNGQLLLLWGPAEAIESVRLSDQVIALLNQTLWVGLLIQDF